MRTFMKSLRVAVAGRGFDVIHACNPPETFWLLALVLAPRSASGFLFDHHDLSPEMYAAKFGRASGLDVPGAAVPRAHDLQSPPTW